VCVDPNYKNTFEYVLAQITRDNFFLWKGRSQFFLWKHNHRSQETIFSMEGQITTFFYGSTIADMSNILKNNEKISSDYATNHDFTKHGSYALTYT